MLQYYLSCSAALLSFSLAWGPVTDDVPLGRRHRLEVPRAGRRKRRCLAFAPLAGAGRGRYDVMGACVGRGDCWVREGAVVTRGRLGRHHVVLRLLFYYFTLLILIQLRHQCNCAYGIVSDIFHDRGICKCGLC